jgi:small-conductance mechanosensitive channel
MVLTVIAFAIAGMAITFMWIDITSSLVSLTTLTLSFSFIFGSQASGFFASLMFIFVRHPYDVGDKVVVNGTTSYVHRIQLGHTVFRSWDEYMTYIPNNVLAGQAIKNITRSKPMYHEVVLTVDVKTEEDKFEQLRAMIGDFLEEEKQSFMGPFDFVYNQIRDSNGLEIVIWAQDRANFFVSDQYKHRSMLMAMLKNAMHTLDIRYFNVASPIVHMGKSPNNMAFGNEIYSAQREEQKKFN